MPAITPSGGIVQGLQDAMGMARDMRAIQNSESENDLRQQQIAENNLKLNQAKKEAEFKARPIPLSTLEMQYGTANPTWFEHMTKTADEMGLIQTNSANIKYMTQENKERLGKMMEEDSKLGVTNLKALNVDITNKLMAAYEQKQQAKKPEDVQAADEQIKQLSEHSTLITDHINKLDADVQGKIAVEQAKAEVKPNDLSYHIEKRQIGGEKVQDYRIFVDKKGNVTKEEPVGKPYTNTEGIARVRVEAFGSVPTSTPGVGYDRVNKMWFQTDATGNKVPLSSAQVQQISLDYKEQLPTNDIKVMQQSAPSVIQLSNQTLKSIDAISNKLGPASSRWADFWSGKVGAANPEFRKLKTDVNLLQTRLMKMHVGARGGEYIMKHFQEIIDAGKDSPENMKAAISEIITYANEVGLPIKEQQKAAVNSAPTKADAIKKKLANKYGVDLQ